MNLSKIIVSTIGVVVIGFVYWFFFGKKQEEVAANDSIDITVDGGYMPQVIKVKKDRTTKLRLTRKDPSTCLEEFILSDFKIKKYLPLGKTVEVEITPDKEGEYAFHCGMNMFHGKVIVKK